MTYNHAYRSWPELISAIAKTSMPLQAQFLTSLLHDNIDGSTLSDKIATLADLPRAAQFKLNYIYV